MKVEEMRKVNVRLDDNDAAALAALHAYVQALVGPGVRVEASDTVRYALHAAVEALVVNGGFGETMRSADNVSAE